jgi:hypothetical protein
MVSATSSKELQNVLPKGNPLASLIEYHRYWAGARWLSAIFTAVHLNADNAVNVTKPDLSPLVVHQQHHWHHIEVRKSFVWFVASKLKRLAKMAAAAPIANFANNSASFSLT